MHSLAYFVISEIQNRKKISHALQNIGTGGAGYKTLLLAVYKTSLFFGGSKVAAYKTSLFFEVPKWLSIKPYFFLKAKFSKGLFPDLVVYKT